MGIAGFSVTRPKQHPRYLLFFLSRNLNCYHSSYIIYPKLKRSINIIALFNFPCLKLINLTVTNFIYYSGERVRDLSQFLAENGPDETDHRYEPAGKFQVDFNYLVPPK